eukprot:CAMPEP_0181516268 /NCGR_PEP_ID=MMETSP1110-20121109/64023_1 /TAXON_ID=174948 /ORGANISM="Symbiodinium sp., Strain CCMP421" /LENGTH=63 /DNA_ID=CAMNT_0023646353 /DNA_START=10 /DNA_END=198 /DNA_ORIENTATION=-
MMVKKVSDEVVDEVKIVKDPALVQMVEPEHHYFSIDVVKTTTVTSLGIDVDLTDGVTMMVKKV